MQFKTLAQAEQEYFMEVYEANGRNKTKTAKDLGLSIKTVYNKLAEYSENQPALGEIPVLPTGANVNDKSNS